MTAALFLAVVLTCAGDPAPGKLDVPLPPPAAVQTVEAEVPKKLDTLEPDVERPRPRSEWKRRILLELLVATLEVAINR